MKTYLFNTWWRELFVLLSLYIVTSSGVASPRIDGFRMASCVRNKCVRMIAPFAEFSQTKNNIYVFPRMTVEWTDKQRVVKSIKAGASYFDISNQILVLRDINASKQDMVIDLAKSTNVQNL